MDESPVKPDNFFFQRHSEIPSAAIRPVVADNSVVFVRRGGDTVHQSVYEIGYDDLIRRYQASDLSYLAPSAIDAPTALAVRQGNERNGTHHLFAVNNDGTAAVLATRRDEGVLAWYKWTTPGGEFVDVAVLGTRTFFLVERGGNFYLEELDDTILTDGQAATSFDWVIETMPITLEHRRGPTLAGNRHRLIHADVQMREAHAMQVNSYDVDLTRYDDSGTAIAASGTGFDGIKRVQFLGWSGGKADSGATVKITGSSNDGGAEILSVTTEVGL